MNNCVVCQGRILRNNLPSAGNRHESHAQCSKFIFVFAVIKTAFRLFSGIASLVGHTPWNGTLHKLLPIPVLNTLIPQNFFIYFRPYNDILGVYITEFFLLNSGQLPR